MRVAFLSGLEKEFAEYQSANKAEDTTRDLLKTTRLALTLLKSEWVQTREMQLGTLLTIFKDRQKVALFTLAWRKTSRTADDEPAAESSPTP